jgi:energy-coupling factor transporter ATP-binding protein EcfA2
VLTPNGAQIDAAVRDAFNEYAFSRRSDGFKRFVSFLILVSARSAASDFSETVFIQDEPDLGLHPSGIKSLLRELIDLSRNNYVLISSHSIFMVDKERIDRHLLVSKDAETTVVKSVDRSTLQDEEVLFNALGYSLFELIKPVNLIFEGWRDKRLFQTRLKSRGKLEKFLKSKLKSELGLTHAMGVKDIPKVSTYLDLLERKSIAITDSDDVAIEKQRQVQGQKPDLIWKRYDELLGTRQVLTAEDFVKAETLRSSLSLVLDEKGLDVPVETRLFQEPPPGGVVQAVNAILVGRGVAEESRKDLLNAWKSQIFDNLTVDDIADNYAGVVAGICALMGYEGESSSEEETA